MCLKTKKTGQLYNGTREVRCYIPLTFFFCTTGFYTLYTCQILPTENSFPFSKDLKEKRS